ncbi:related to TAO3 - Transcriptional Activator of OCH1 [Melanopsichium pennsylvanicum]|uniref:Related to TAO3 - Transcriptional Activator of OCH1 n=2 Tax=Melanopsichium pennsylvanicum TaxID=63383 RepID=A0AAJ4XGG9_9BASI|nr:related to TAO3-Transcriptional Activator of OCH1 [Melanopsichium pennsylvanicum 4]SNX81636.1 related to TAO3 - Transcriptional Activator of OCH1 [Melanopsichium pennsylvanicum]
MQVVIPDLDDKQLFAPPRRIHSPPASVTGSSNHHSARPSLDQNPPSSSRSLQNITTALPPLSNSAEPSSCHHSPSSYNHHNAYTQSSTQSPTYPNPLSGPFRGAALGWHGRSGSATSDSSAGGFGGLGFRMPSNQTRSEQELSATSSSFNAPLPTAATSDATSSGFSFSNKHPSLSSLRSHVRAQQHQLEAEPLPQDQWPTTPREPPRLEIPAPSSDAADLTVGYRSGFSTPRPPPPASNSHFQHQHLPSPGFYSPPDRSAPLATLRERNDSYASSPSRLSGHTTSASRSSRYHHAPTASFHSDSHNSTGGMSSSASSSAYPYAGSITDLPPVPPLPASNESIYADMPVTPGGHTNNAAFQIPRAMASTTSFEISDFGASPHKHNTRQLREDHAPTRPPRTFDENEDTSSGDHAQWSNTHRSLRRLPQSNNARGASPASARPNALAVSLGAEGLGQLPPGIGTPDPQAPVEYALNILMSRFISLATAKVKRALDSAQDSHPRLLCALSLEEDALFDSVCDSLAHISRKGAASVIRSLFRWKAITIDADVDADLVRRHLAAAPPAGASTVGTRDIAVYLARRKELFAIHLVTKALVIITKVLTRDSLGEAQAAEFEEQTFTMLLACTREKDKDRPMPRSITHVRDACFESVSQLIGEISRTRFVTISDRFVEILEQSTKAPASKTVEDLLVAAIQSLRHLKITNYPMELFEEGADFVDVLARHYAHCHGFRVKTSFAEAFAHLMLPVAQTASAEVNHPTWTKAIDTIWPRMTAMAAKPRYWSVAYPLHVTLLAVSPEEKLTSNWFACVEAGVAKLKDRVHRSVVLNAVVRLLWAYAFRCHESHTNTHKKLENFFRIWFPANRRSLNPSDSSPDPFIMMVHYALYRHFDFGRELLLGFLCHSALGGSTLSLQSDVLSGQRMTIAIRAILLTLHAHVKSESPLFPCGADFHRFDFDTLPEGCGDELPEGFKYPKAEIGEAQIQFNDLICKIALLCDHQISDMTIFDARTHLFARNTPNTAASTTERAILERDGMTWRLHRSAMLMAAYPRENQSFSDLLRACFESWPRCLSPNIPFSNVLGVLFRAHFSADPDLSGASARALRRIASQRPGGSSAVVSGFMRWIFRMDTAFWEIHPKQLLVMPKIEEAVRLWIDFLNVWLAELRIQNSQADQGQPSAQKGFEMERTSAWALMDEVEAYALFLLCSAARSLRALAIEVLRLIAVLDDAFLSPSRRAAAEQARAQGEEEEPSRIVHLLDMPCQEFLDANDPHLSWHQINHLARWKSPDRSTSLRMIAESEREVEQSLWFRALPLFLRMSLDRFPTTVAVFRSYITNRVLEMDHVAVYAADISNRVPANTMNSATLSKSQAASAASASLHTSTSMASLRDVAAAGTAGQAEHLLMAQHWRFYVLALCTTTTSTEGSRGGVVGNHRRKSSEPESGERMISARDLFQKLVPFLASDSENFQEAVVFALGNINENHYLALLETMQALSGTLTEDFRVRSVARTGLKRNRRLDRLRTALAHVLQLTAPHMEALDHLDSPKVVAIIHNWVKETFTFLTDREIRQDWEFHSLRRYFCGVMQHFFDGLAKRRQADKHFPLQTRLRMFRVFRDWHSYSTVSVDGRNKLANLLSTAADQQRDDRAKERAVKTLNYETQALSYQAGCAMASLCQGVISMEGGPAPAPMEGSSLDPTSLLHWLSSLFQTSDEKNHGLARKALRSLLIYNDQNAVLVDDTVDRCITEHDRALGKKSVFVTTAEVVIEKEDLSMPLHAIFCLGLVKLGHPDSSIRRKALSVLDICSRRFDESCTLDEFEVGVSSPLPAIYLRAQRDVNAHLAMHFDGLRTAMLSEFTRRLPLVEASRRATILGLLPEWLRGLILHTADPHVDNFPAAPPEVVLYRAFLNLSNLFCLTVRYGDEYNFEIQEMWSSLVASSDDVQSAGAVISFLIDQGLHFRSEQVVNHSKRVVSCISHTQAGPHIFEQLCTMIEPSRMIQVPRNAPAPMPDPDHRHLYRADLNKLLPEPESTIAFSHGQLALFYVGEMTYERREQLETSLPTLLHAIFLHIDSRSAFVRTQVVELFEQLMRCTISIGASVASNASITGSSSTPVDPERTAAAKAQVEKLFARRTFANWAAETSEEDYDTQSRMPKNLLSTADDTLALIEPFFAYFRQDWGSVALTWAASNPIRHMACRSFQIFRALQPSVTPSMMVTLLGRLADTVSDHKPEVHRFTLEVLYALNLVVKHCEPFNREFLAQTWWATLACLSTVNEAEFAESASILEGLVDRLDIGSPDVIAFLVQKCPEGWEGDVGVLRILVSRGLRSSETSAPTFRLMAKLAKCRDPALIDFDDQCRLGYLFVAALPWFFQVTEESLKVADGSVTSKNDPRNATTASSGGKKGSADAATGGRKGFSDLNTPVLTAFETQMALEMAADLAVTAAHLQMRDLERVATSIARSRFRTKDDLVRQAVNCIRSHYLPEHGPELAVLLLGVVLNRHEWMRRQAMQVLKIFFQALDTRNHAAFSNLGSELLMPLLRQLSTPLSSQALEVLDEPIVVHGGPAAIQILRMSLQWGNMPLNAQTRDFVHDASIFGPPQESGWAVADPQDMATRSRINLQALVKMCERTLDIIPTGNNVNFVVDDAYEGDHVGFALDEAPGVGGSRSEDHRKPSGGSLGDIVNQLHDLSSFFGDDPMSKDRQVSVMWRDSRLDRSGSMRLASGGSLGRTGSLRSNGLSPGNSIGRNGSIRLGYGTSRGVSPNPTVVPETSQKRAHNEEIIVSRMPYRGHGGEGIGRGFATGSGDRSSVSMGRSASTLSSRSEEAGSNNNRSRAQIAKILARSTIRESSTPLSRTNSGTASIPEESTAAQEEQRYRSDSETSSQHPHRFGGGIRPYQGGAGHQQNASVGSGSTTGASTKSGAGLGGRERWNGEAAKFGNDARFHSVAKSSVSNLKHSGEE